MNKITSARSIIAAGAKDATKASGDRSKAVARISGPWAMAVNEDRARRGDAMADKDELSDELAAYAVAEVRKDMEATAKWLLARAKRLTADDVRVIANATGTSAELFVPGELASPDTLGEGHNVNVSVRVKVAPASLLGRTLRKVAPRRAAKAATGE